MTAAVFSGGQACAKSDNLLDLSLEQLLNLEVFAEKRKQASTEVPLSLYTFSQNSIASASWTRIEEIAEMAPSVSYDKRIDFTKSSMKIRGIGTLVFGAGVEPSVATFVDGVVMARGGAGFFELSDVEQIEVLLGPQGTLFGKNASAGLIHVITKKPSFEKTESQLDLRIAENQDYRASYTLSGPINSNLAYRINTSARRYDGNVTNIFNNRSLNGVDAEGVRTKLNWRSDHDTDILLSFDYSKQASSQGVRVLRVDSETVLLDPAAIGSSGPAGTAGEITGIAGDKDNTLVNLNREPLATSEAYGLSLEVNFPWQDHTLTSLSAYREWQQHNDRDNDQTQLDFSLMQRENRDTDWFSQEFRITSALNDRCDYVAGLYYYQSDTFDNSGDSRTFSNPGYVYEYNMAKNDIINTNIAAFGQFNWHHTSSLTSFYGLRYLYDKVEADLSRVAYTQNNSYLSDGQVTAVRDVAGISNDDSTRKLIGKVGAKYNFTADIMSYISWSSGFKGAAFNTSFKFDPNTFVNEEPVKPEESKTLEIGLRSLWLDSRLRLDATLFRTNYKGLQLTARDLENNRNIIDSVPNVISQGLELSSIVQLPQQWSINVAVTYLDATYKDFTNANCYAHQTEAQGCIRLAGGNVQDLSGHSLPNAPRLSAAANISKHFRLKDFHTAIDLQVRAQDRTNLDPAGSPAAEQAGFAVTNISFSLLAPDKQYTAKVFINNLFDKHYINGITINGNAGGDLMLQLLPQDFSRIIGSSISFQF